MHASYEKLKTNDNSLFLFQEFHQYRLDSPFHYHDEVELVYFKKGHGKLFVGNKVTTFNDNECYLFASGLPHCFYNMAKTEIKEEKVQVYLFQFRSDFMDSNIVKIDEAKSLNKLLDKAAFGIRFINLPNRVIEKIMHMDKSMGIKRVADFLYILHDLINHKKTNLLTTQVNVIHNETDISKNILDVYQYVYNNFQKDISFSQAATIAHMQKAAFCRYFKRKALKTFSNFVNEVRITHAQKLLAETDKTIYDICLRSGYNNLAYFNRQFKLFVKITPLQYKKQLKMEQ